MVSYKRTSRLASIFLLALFAQYVCLSIPNAMADARPHGSAPLLTLQSESSVELVYTFDSHRRGFVVDETLQHHGLLRGTASIRRTNAFDQRSLSLNNVNARVEIPSLILTGTELSLLTWVRVEHYGNDPRIFSTAGGVSEDEHDIMLGLTGANLRARLNINGDTRTLIATEDSVPLNEWVHVALTYDGTTLSLYQNGALVGALSATGEIQSRGFPTWIGNQPNSGSYNMNLTGRLDNFMVLTRAVTQEEIMELALLPDTGGCGNGIVEENEQCDDGNTLSGDGCSHLCVVEFCGDSILQPALGEECDDGNHLPGDGCDEACFREDIDGGNAPILTPGNGNWSSPNLNAYGSGPGSQSKAIARWDVAPHTTIDGEFGVGVVAFHQNGINRIDFQLNGGPVTSVTQMTSNPYTQTANPIPGMAQTVTEYWGLIRATDFSSSGVAELRAVVYPQNAGVPIQLEPLKLNIDTGDQAYLVRHVATNGTDSQTCGNTQQSPCRTIPYTINRIVLEQGNADRGTLYLAPGSYELAPGTGNVLEFPTVNQYLTISGAPGTSRSEVKLIDSGTVFLNTERLKIANLTSQTGQLTTDHPYTGRALLSQNVHFLGTGQHSLTGPGSQPWHSPTFPWNAMSMIDCEVSDARFGPTMSYFQRGTYIHHIGEDVFRYPGALINIVVEEVQRAGSVHPDLIEISGGYTNENMIIYNLRATDVNAQGIFVKGPSSSNPTTLRDSALVNVVIHKNADAWTSQFASDSIIDNVIFINTTFPNTSLLFRTPHLSNLSFRGNIMSVGVTDGGFLQDGWFNNNHFLDSTSSTPGTNVSSGDVQFIDPAGLNFHLSPDSVARGRISSEDNPGDIEGTLRGELGSLGAYE